MELMKAVISNDLDEVRYLIKTGIDLNYREKKYGLSPIIICSHLNRIDIMEELLEHLPKKYFNVPRVVRSILFNKLKYLDINHQTKSGRSALAHAALRGNKEILAKLIDKGANINILDKNDNPAIHFAIIYQHVETIKILLQNGANTDLIKFSTLNSAIYSGSCKILELLMEYDSNLINKHGCAMAIAAIKYGQIDVIKLLIKHKLNVNERDQEGNNMLIYCVHFNRLNIFRILIKSWAEVNLTNNAGKDALYYALKKNNLMFIETLIMTNLCEIKEYHNFEQFKGPRVVGHSNLLENRIKYNLIKMHIIV